MAMSEPTEVTRLLLSWSGGDRAALDQIVPLVHRELRRVAASYLKSERRGHTLQPTDLVHETYLRLVEQTHINCHTRAQFFGIAANLTRQILVNYAESHRAAKRGGGNNVALKNAVTLLGQEREFDLFALDDALKKLARLDPRKGRIVELRFFGGMTEEEIAEVLEISRTTVKRDWRLARIVLYKQLDQGILD